MTLRINKVVEMKLSAGALKGWGGGFPRGISHHSPQRERCVGLAASELGPESAAAEQIDSVVMNEKHILQLIDQKFVYVFFIIKA